MKGSEIKEGGRYMGKIGTRVVPVEVLGRARYGGGWRVRSLLSGYETTFRSGQKFRRVADEDDVAWAKGAAERPKLVAAHVVGGRKVKVHRLGRDFLLTVDGNRAGETFRSKKAALASVTAEADADAEAAAAATPADPAERDYFRATGGQLRDWSAEGDEAAAVELDRRTQKRAAKLAAAV